MLNNVGEVARCQGDYARAASLYEESLPLLREASDTRGVALALGNLGHVLYHLGEGERAEALLKESLRLKHGFGDEIGLSYCFAGLAAITAAADPARAARLLGTAQDLLERTGHHLDAADRADFDRTYAALQAQTGEAALTAAFKQGRLMSLEQAVAYALESS